MKGQDAKTVPASRRESPVGNSPETVPERTPEATLQNGNGPRSMDDIEILIRARYPLLYIVSYEEERVEEHLADIAARRNKKIYSWSSVRGLTVPGESLQSQRRVFEPSTRDPLEAMDEVIKQVQPSIFVFRDLHPFMRDHAVVRKLRELSAFLKNSYKTVVLLSPVLNIPSELEKDISVVDFSLPDMEALGGLLDRLVAQVRESTRLDLVVDRVTREKILQAARGLTLKEAENALARALIMRGRLGEAEVNIILDEKKQVIRKSGILEYYSTDENLESVGGLEHLKDWMVKRRVAFTEKAREYGLPQPKGVLLIGVQGCGKSLCAKAVSRLWDLPLLRLDMGRIFSSHVGSSEENMRRAIQTAESVAPAIVWVDEVEKSMSGIEGSSSQDAGTAARVFGTFITWLQEKTAPVFVIATANQIRLLPPELMRKGRFDEIFFVDLPGQKAREEIFTIHLQKRQRDPSKFDRAELARRSPGFSGSEIEQAIISAMYDAFDGGEDLRDGYIYNSLAQTVPLSRTMEEEIKRLREWADSRARMASLPDEDNSAASVVGRVEHLEY